MDIPKHDLEVLTLMSRAYLGIQAQTQAAARLASLASPIEAAESVDRVEQRIQQEATREGRM